MNRKVVIRVATGETAEREKAGMTAGDELPQRSRGIMSIESLCAAKKWHRQR